MKNIAIKENHLYQKAYRQGKRYVGKYVAVYLLRDYAAGKLREANPQKKYVNRVGLSVSKKIGSAVRRNRAKRIIRAAYDPLRDEIKTGFLIVISAREAIRSQKSPAIERELRAAFSSLNMFRASQKPSSDGGTSDTQKSTS